MIKPGKKSLGIGENDRLMWLGNDQVQDFEKFRLILFQIKFHI